VSDAPLGGDFLCVGTVTISEETATQLADTMQALSAKETGAVLRDGLNAYTQTVEQHLVEAMTQDGMSKSAARGMAAKLMSGQALTYAQTTYTG